MWYFIQDSVLSYDGSINWFPLIMLVCMGSLLLFAVLAIIYWIVESIGFAMAPCQYEMGRITNKYYKPESNSIGFGTAVNYNGQVSPVMTTSYSSDAYIIEYQSSNTHKKHRIETNEEKYDELEIGDRVQTYYKISKTVDTLKFTGRFEKIK